MRRGISSARWRVRTVATLRSCSQRSVQHEREGEDAQSHPTFAARHFRYDKLMDICLDFAELAAFFMNCFFGFSVGLVH